MIRKAKDMDLPGILQVYDCARRSMRENGNPHQWGEHYPEKEILLQDIAEGNAYVWEENNHIGGVFVLIFGDDPTYAEINGAWLNERPYGTLHRVAGDGTVKGLMEKCLAYCFRQTDNLRVDTHADNRIMQHILQKNGFQYCGRIRVGDGSERLAYQKCHVRDSGAHPKNAGAPESSGEFICSAGGPMKSPVCPVAKKCGGCQYQTLSYPEQLKRKQKLANDLLKKFCRVEPILGMEQPFYYRNKVHAVFSRDARGNIISGTYQANSHRMVAVEHCLIEDQKCQEIIHTIRGMLKSFKIKTYDEDSGYGLLRHVLVRRGFQTGEILVILVLGSPIFPSRNNFVKALRKAHPEITSLVLNVNDKKTSMVLGDWEKPIYGAGFIRDRLCGCTFRISPKSFYQVNPVQTEVLYRKAIGYAGLTGKECVIDAYCGIGTIGLVAAGHAKQVIGVELNPDAVRDARINAKENKIANARFYQGDAGEFMTAMAERGEHADVVFLDPPRAGSSKAFLAALVRLSPKRVVYVSCEPLTLARDLQYLTEKGYAVKKVQPLDMFPLTEKIECIALLSKLK